MIPSTYQMTDEFTAIFARKFENVGNKTPNDPESDAGTEAHQQIGRYEWKEKIQWEEEVEQLENEEHCGNST